MKNHWVQSQQEAPTAPFLRAVPMFFASCVTTPVGDGAVRCTCAFPWTCCYYRISGKCPSEPAHIRAKPHMQVVKSSGPRPHRPVRPPLSPCILFLSVFAKVASSTAQSLHDELRTLVCKTEGMDAALHEGTAAPRAVHGGRSG